MAIKTINDITGFNGLISTFLVFRIYFYILEFDFLISTIIQHIAIIKNIIKIVQKMKAERQIADILNQKN